MDEMVTWLTAGRGVLNPLATAVLVLAASLFAALIVHRIILATLTRVVARTRGKGDDIMLRHASRPMQWIVLVIAAGLAQRAAPLSDWATDLWRQAIAFIFPALLGWLAFELVSAFRETVEANADISMEDNLQARRRRTRVGILTRIATVLVLFLTICMMLLSIPGVRSVGVTLMASAGLAGLAVGAAAQPALKNLIAGVQMAFTEPIRIDDVVIMDNEWGRIEEIRLTYVVVKLWDERRLVVPVSKFLEGSFQNWTRSSSQLLGSAFLYVDPTADVDRIRSKVEEVVKADPLWDGRFFNLQVTDIKPDVMELRVLMTARDASRAFDLRCNVREKLMGFIAREMPLALPRRRVEPAGWPAELAGADEAGTAAPAH